MDNLFDLTGQTILLTGATGYIGKVFAKELAKRNANLILVSRDLGKLEELKNSLSGFSVTVNIHSVDLMNEKSIETFVSKLGELKINGIVNNAYSGGGGSIKTSSSEDFKNSYQINVITPFLLIKKLLPNLKIGFQENSNASVVNISSMYGVVVPDFSIYENEKSYNPPFYGTSKAGVRHFTKYCAVEFAQDNIRVNTITPGAFPNEDAQKNKTLIDGIIRNCPMERIGTPEELVGSLLYYLSKASTYTTGSELVVDGGWTIRT